MKYLDYLLSFINGRLVEKIQSPYNGELFIYYANGKYILNSLNGNYSFGELHVAFRKIFRKLNIQNRQIKNVLLLGLGGGSVVSLIYDEFKIKCSTLAVDCDTAIIEIARKYFHIDSFENLTIRISDAFDFMKENNEQFDLVVFDIYVNNEIPLEFESINFFELLFKSISPGGLLVFNKDINSSKMSESLTEFEQKFGKVFKNYQKHQVVKNNFFYMYSPGVQ